MNKDYDFKKLYPFKWFVLENFPFIEADFDAITNWQLFCKLGKEMNKIIDSVNLSGEQVENLTNAYNDLKTYVDNYFDTLDVQEEINNKLDEMAEGGQLAEIIGQYLNTNAIFGFNNITTLKTATNLVNGSFTRTFGKFNYNDGLGAFYKVREILNTDTIDDDNIVALQNPNLVAEKIPDANITNILRDISTINQNIDDINENITEIEDSLIKNRLLVIGDSWSVGTNKWHTFLGNELNLTVDNYSVSGTGFVHSDTPNNTFAEQIATAYNDMTEANRNKVKYIIVYGGVNDWRNSVQVENIKTGIENVINNAKQYFPDALLYIIPLTIGKANQSIYNGFGLYRTRVIHDALSLGNANICQTASFWLMSYSDVWEESTGEILHPNTTGHKIIASYILSILLGNYDGVHRTIVDTQVSNGIGFKIDFNNGIINVSALLNGYTGTTVEIYDNAELLFLYKFGTNPTDLFGTGIIVGGESSGVLSSCMFVAIRSTNKIQIESRSQTFNNNTIIINSSFTS